MAEPTNTPMPTAPPTPRSNSPAPPIPGASPSSIATSPTTLPLHPMSSLLSPALAHLPVIPSRLAASPSPSPKPVVLQLGDHVPHNRELCDGFARHFTVVRPTPEEHERDAFMAALREGRWGFFDAVLRCSWGSGGEMGPWDTELVGLLPDSMKVFASVGAGIDGADTKLLGERGIVYCKPGSATADAVSETAVAMIISTFRKLPYLYGTAAANPDLATSFSIMQAHNLRGRVLGIVGLGDVGQRIARTCSAAFGMRVLYHDVERKDDSGGAIRFTYDLEDLYHQVDCVVLCEPPPGAGCLVNARSLEWFRPGARLVSVAHGSFIDEDAVAAALEYGRLSAVALNTQNVSPQLQKFVGLRVMLTCRSTSDTAESRAELEEVSMKNIELVTEGGEASTPENAQWLRR
ncbi:hypothetical protein F4810DRAFT_150199 [Camillea tinctor]|nr:hypothetical protein F4810DRAFT_150199 [Camillea tinctor]